MRLNLLERLFINSPLRAVLQDLLESRQLLALGGPAKAARVLEVGCGPGGGIPLLFRKFGVASVDAFDLDPRMVRRVRRRFGPTDGAVRLWVGNLRQIPVADGHYDAVFNFGVIHHVVDWRAAIAEIYRVLKPGGRFYCEEILKRYITHPVIGRLMDHPQQDRFDAPDFVAALGEKGFTVEGTRQMADLYLWLVAVKASTH